MEPTCPYCNIRLDQDRLLLLGVFKCKIHGQVPALARINPYQPVCPLYPKSVCPKCGDLLYLYVPRERNIRLKCRRCDWDSGNRDDIPSQEEDQFVISCILKKHLSTPKPCSSTLSLHGMLLCRPCFNRSIEGKAEISWTFLQTQWGFTPRELPFLIAYFRSANCPHPLYYYPDRQKFLPQPANSESKNHIHMQNPPKKETHSVTPFSTETSTKGLNSPPQILSSSCSLASKNDPLPISQPRNQDSTSIIAADLSQIKTLLSRITAQSNSPRSTDTNMKEVRALIQQLIESIS